MILIEENKKTRTQWQKNEKLTKFYNFNIIIILLLG